MNPEQAIEELVGEQFIEWLRDYVNHNVQALPEIASISSARPKPERLKKFMLQLFLANQAFFGAKEGDPGFLRFAIANLSESSDPTAETALEILEQRRHQELLDHAGYNGGWNKLLQALGASGEEIDRTEPKEVTRNLIADLSEIYSNSEWPTAVGAIAGGELITPIVYQAVSTLLKSNTSLTDKELAILNAKTENINHILDKVVFDPQTKGLVWDGVTRQIEAQKDFLSALTKYLEV